MPFALEPDSRFLVMGAEHKEALATLIYAIEQREGWALLLGDAGVGKTTLIMALLRELGEVVVPAVITNPLLDPLDFFNMIALELGMDGPFTSKGQFLIAFGQLITQCRQENKVLLLVIDEAHSLTPRLLEELRLLGNLDSAVPRVLNIFLVGQPKVVLLMKKAGARGLMQRLHRHYLLKPLPVDEVGNYIRHRLQVAGGSPDIFDEGAIEEVHSVTNGIPRVINALCDEALIAAYSQGKRRVDRELVRQAAGNDAALISPSPHAAEAAPKREVAPEAHGPAPRPSGMQPPSARPEPEPDAAGSAPRRQDGFPAPAAMGMPGGAPRREPSAKPEPEIMEEPALSKREQKTAARQAKENAKQQIKQRKTGLGSRFASSMSKDRPGSLWRRLALLIIILSLLAATYVFTSQDGLRQVKRWWWILKGRPGPGLFLPDAGSQPERKTKAEPQKSAGEKDWGPNVPLSSPGADTPQPQGGQHG